jgi:hypothetical protein
MSEFYTPSQLAKRFNVSRTTVYNKFAAPELQGSVYSTPDGKRLAADGLQAFRLLLSDSKAGQQAERKFTSQSTSTAQAIFTTNDPVVDALITEKQQRIEQLEREIARLEKEKDRQEQRIMFMEQHITRITPQLLPGNVPDKQPGFFRRIFGGRGPDRDGGKD